MNGTQCGSPALRRRRRCFFHDRIRRERAKIAADTSAPRPFDLPLLEDTSSVQVALMKVIQMLGSGCMDHKTGGLILYALQTASVNLRHATFEALDVTDVVIDPDTVDATCIGGQQWFEEDFEAAEESEDEAEDEIEEDSTEDETDDETENAAGGNAEQADPPPAKKPAAVKQITGEEVRTQVRGMVRNWLREQVQEKADEKLDEKVNKKADKKANRSADEEAATKPG